MASLRIPALTFTLVFAFIAVSGQVNYENRKYVLEKGIVDSLFVFGKWTEKGETETRLKYLGQVTTTDGRTFKVITSIWLWGLSCRATSRILIFNGKDQYLGNYYVWMTYDLPDKIENGKLVFTNTSEECDQKVITTIDLTHGLPKSFFLKCTNESEGYTGHFYAFQTE